MGGVIELPTTYLNRFKALPSRLFSTLKASTSWIQLPFGKSIGNDHDNTPVDTETSSTQTTNYNDSDLSQIPSTVSCSSSPTSAPLSPLHFDSSQIATEEPVGKILIALNIESSSATGKAPKEAAPPWPWMRTIHRMILKLKKAVLEIPLRDHSVFEILSKLELAKHILVLAIPMVIALFAFYDPVKAHPMMRVTALLVSVAVSLIWNGMLLRTTFNRASNLMEVLGIVLMFAAFFSFAAFILPGNFALIPLICFIFSLVPFGIAFCCKAHVAPETQALIMPSGSRPVV